jgi:uncharacterized caspase-like protein
MKALLSRPSLLTLISILAILSLLFSASGFARPGGQKNSSAASRTVQQKPQPVVQQHGIKVQPEAKAETEEMPNLEKPDANRWALIIGVNDYNDSSVVSLTAPNEDAKNLAKTLTKYGAFPSRNITLLTSDQTDFSLQPTRDNIVEQIEKLKKNLTEDSLLLFAFMGHGYELSGKEGYLLPRNAKVSSQMVLDNTALSRTFIESMFKEMRVKRVLYFIDACRNSTQTRSLLVKQDSKVYTPNITANSKGLQLFAQMFAASPGQEAVEANGQGFFTTALVEGLEKATNEEGNVTLGALYTYVEKRLPEIARKYTGNKIDQLQKPELNVQPLEQRNKFIISHNPDRVQLGYLKLVSSVPSANVTLKANGKAVLEETLSGTGLDKTLNPGVYQLEVTAKGYRKWTKEINLKRGANNPVEANLESSLGSIYIDLGDIKATEKGLQILIDDQPVKFAPVSGTPNECRIKDIEEGARKLRIQFAGATVLDSNVTVEAGDTRVVKLPSKNGSSITLPATGTLVLTSNVATAEVIIKPQGKAPFSKALQNRRLELALLPGDYEVEVTAAGKYKSWKRSITIKQGSLIDRDVDLLSTAGTVSIDLGSVNADDRELKITLDGQPVTPVKIAANKVELRNIDEATHQLKIVHPSFAESVQSVNVYGGQTTSVNLAFKSLLIPVTINSLPGAKISIGSQPVKFVPASGKLFIPNLPPGQYVVKAELSGYNALVQSRTFDAGKEYEFELKPIAGPRTNEPETLSLLSSIKLQFDEPIGAEAQVLVNGQKLGASKVSRLDRLVEIKDLNAGHYTIQVRHPKSGNTDTQEVEVEAATKIQIPVRFTTRLIKLTLRSEPGTDIYVDGEFKGRLTGNELPIQLAPGDHRLKAVNDRFEELLKPISVSKEEVLDLALTPAVFSTKFNEEFTSLQNWTAQKWELSQKKNEVFMIVKGPEAGFIKDRKYGDFSLRFTLSFARQNRKGAVWVVRARDEQNYYLFQLVCAQGNNPAVFRTFVIKNGIVVRKFEEGVPINLNVPDDQIHIFVDAVGSTITHRISSIGSPAEKPVIFSEMEDKTFASGKLGFMTRDGEEFWIRSISVLPK